VQKRRNKHQQLRENYLIEKIIIIINIIIIIIRWNECNFGQNTYKFICISYIINYLFDCSVKRKIIYLTAFIYVQDGIIIKSL